MLPNPKNIRVWPSWLAIAILIFLDSISKTIVRAELTPGSSISLLGIALKITYIQNYRGVSWWVPELPAWSNFILQGLFFFVVLAAYPVYLFYANQRRHTAWVDIAFVGIVAACTGHLLNNLVVPYTVDFIQIYHSPSANFADLYSYVGIIALGIEIVQQYRNRKHFWRGIRQWVGERKSLRNEFIEYYRRGR
jgi:lipoprotein signal peptidase